MSCCQEDVAIICQRIYVKCIKVESEYTNSPDDVGNRINSARCWSVAMTITSSCDIELTY